MRQRWVPGLFLRTIILTGLLVLVCSRVVWAQTELEVECDPQGATLNIEGLAEYTLPQNIRLKEVKAYDMVFSAPGYLDEKVVLYAHYNKYNTLGCKTGLAFKKLNIHLIKLPAKTSSQIQIDFWGIGIDADSSKEIGELYEYRKNDLQTSVFVRKIKWSEMPKVKTSELIKIGLDKLPAFGYNFVEGAGRKDLMTLQNAALMVRANIKNISYHRYDGCSNTYEEVEYDINWVVKRPGGKELLQITTKATASKYNDEKNRLFADAFKRGLFSFVSSAEFSNLLKKSEEALENDTSEPPLLINAVDKKEFISAESLIREVVPSVVTVIRQGAHGSGFFISSDGLIVTNFHVVDGASSLQVELATGDTFPAELIKVSELEDLALLKIKRDGFKPLRVISTEEVNLGKEVYAIGTPADRSLGQSVTKGIISGKRKFNDRVYIQSDVKVNSGNSGGPLIDKDGNVLGIVNAKISGAGLEGLGFAIPAYYIFKSLNVSYK